MERWWSFFSWVLVPPPMLLLLLPLLVVGLPVLGRDSIVADEAVIRAISRAQERSFGLVAIHFEATDLLTAPRTSRSPLPHS